MKHTHKYVRIKIGESKRVRYKCAIPGCSHHIAKELVLGRMTICNRCNKEFVMNKEAMQKAFPRCFDCIDRKGTTHKDIDKLHTLEDFIKGIM